MAKKILNWTLNIIIIFLIVLLGARLFWPNITLNMFGINMYLVGSDSMEPLIMTNDMVWVRRMNDARFADLEPGDVIVFYADHRMLDGEIRTRLTIHYFYGVDGDRILTYSRQHLDAEGNHRPGQFDPVGWNVTRDRVIGQHIGTMRTAALVQTVRNPIFIVSIVVLIAGVVGLVWFAKSTKKQEAAAKAALAAKDQTNNVVIDHQDDPAQIETIPKDSDKK